MIRFLLTRGHHYTLEQVRKSRQAPHIGLMNYDTLIRARWLRRATYVFADIDRLSFWDLELASRVYLQLKNAGLSVWNNPVKVKTRYPLLRALHTAGLNDFNAYRVDEINSAMRFPVFLRKLHGHDGALSDLLHTQEDVEKAIEVTITAGIPAQNLVVIEFAGEPVRPGVYRKLSAFRIGGSVVQLSCMHNTLWLVKLGKIGIAGEELYRDGLNLVQTNPFAEHLQKVFELACIDYGRADFGFYQGRLQVYEINTNPHINPPSAHPSASYVETMRLDWENFLRELSALDSNAGGWPIRLDEGNLQRHRSWRNLFDRSRAVP